ncbi:MAG: hypothetical protein R2707_16520 [Acidimicrobiales bacterium]
MATTPSNETYCESVNAWRGDTSASRSPAALAELVGSAPDEFALLLADETLQDTDEVSAGTLAAWQRALAFDSALGGRCRPAEATGEWAEFCTATGPLAPESSWDETIAFWQAELVVAGPEELRSGHQLVLDWIVDNGDRSSAPAFFAPGAEAPEDVLRAQAHISTIWLEKCGLPSFDN